MRIYQLWDLELDYIVETGRWFVTCGLKVVKVGTSPNFYAAIEEFKKLF